MQRTKLKAIDLFCGCGGMSCGLSIAGFEILAGVDIESKALATFKYNFPQAQNLLLDLSKISPKNFMKQLGIKEKELDLVAGGPPCQGFSKNVPRKLRCSDDPNNILMKRFLDFCEVLQPAMILMENVAEMKNGFDQKYTGEVIERLTGCGYTVKHGVLNAANYGVPQRRRRAFFIANRFGKEFELPSPTHSKPSKQLNLSGQLTHCTVWDAIGDLPSLKHGEGNEICKYASKPNSDYQKLMRNRQEEVTNHVARWLKPVQFERLASIEPGQGHKDLPKQLQVNGGYSGAYGRLEEEMIAPTITRWVFHPGSGRWGHPRDIRLLTMREVARLQSFPDVFRFLGSYTQQAAQLGNAAPPLLIKVIAESMLSQLESPRLLNNSVNLSNEIFSSGPGNTNVITCGSPGSSHQAASPLKCN